MRGRWAKSLTTHRSESVASAAPEDMLSLQLMNRPLYDKQMHLVLRFVAPEHLATFLKDGAVATGKSQSAIMRHLLERYLSQAVSDLLREHKGP